MIIVDENGNKYENLGRALRAYGISQGSSYYTRLKRDGTLQLHGHTFTAGEGEIRTEPSTRIVTETVEDPLMAKLRDRYSEDELKAIAAGQGIAKSYIPFPKITLHGKHHRILAMSDTHIGSVFSPEAWHDTVSAYANDPANGIECVLHCGDLVEGLKGGYSRPSQIYECSAIGYAAQRDKAVELMGKYAPPVYVISGNHDGYFQDSAGADIVKDVCDRLPNMTYIGHDSADVHLDGCTIRLFHGGDGSSYAVSYRLQKLVEAINGGHKPNILLAGHVHKFCYILERNIHALDVPAMQAQTSFMRSKKISAATGFLVLDFDVKDGNVCNFGVTYYPFYA